ncbi:hypothetical protein Dsin_016778, partial [Dipteronia sinensis]
IFNSSNPTQHDINKVLEGCRPRIDPNMSGRLDSKFTEDEIKRAIFEMNPIKAPCSGRCSRGGSIISHLFFEDDSLLFTKANEKNCKAIRTIFVEYERATVQALNFGKSAMCISPSFSAKEGERLASMIGVKLMDCHENYLGLQFFSGINKRKIFANIVDRVWNKVKG